MTNHVDPYELRVTAPAQRQLERLPDATAEAIVEFTLSALVDDPRRLGGRLQGKLAGLQSTHRGAYRVVYEIDDDERAVIVLDITHRSRAHRFRQHPGPSRTGPWRDPADEVNLPREMAERPVSEPVRELGLRDYVGVVRRRRGWVVLTPLIVLLVVVGVTVTRQRVYEATTEVLILTDANQAIFQTTAATTDRLQRNPVAEQQYLSGEEFRNDVGLDADGVQSMTYELGRTDPDEDLADVAILRFVARADTATEAAAVANSAAELYVDSRHQQDRARVTEQLEALNATLVRLRAAQVEADDQLASLRAQLENSLSEAEQVQVQFNIATLEEEQLELAGRARETTDEIATLEQVSSDLDDPDAAARIHNPAVTPDAPVSPDVQRNIVLAAIVGLVLGVALAIARDLLDGSARDPVELARVTGAPVLGSVEVMPTDADEIAPTTAHRYRTILTSLALSSPSPTLHTIGVTSATASVGKTETVVNLARVEAATGSRVLIIDGNPVAPLVLSRLDPSERRQIDLDLALAAEPVAASSNSVAAADDAWERSRRPSSSDDRNGARVREIDVIDLFASESATRDPLRHTAMDTVLKKLAKHYDLILIDTQAVLSSVGVGPMLTGADAVVVVYVPRRSRVDDLERAVELLRGGGVHVSGLIANRAPSVAPDRASVGAADVSAS